MKKYRLAATMILGVMVVALLLMATGCKKQPKCGCNGDALGTLSKMPVSIVYDAINKTARFSPANNPYEIYHFCNPSEWIGELSKFQQGDEVEVSGPFFYECNYLIQNSNSPYGSYWRIYQIQVTELAVNPYGK